MKVADPEVQLLQAMADPVRLSIVRQLAAGDDAICACDFTECCTVSQPTVSHHLKVLRDAGLLEQRRHSYWTYYRLNRAAFAALGDRMSSLSKNACEPGNGRPCC